MTADKRNGADGSGAATLSSGITITGDVECAGELQISGKVNGAVRAPAVFVEAHGEVRGGIIADRLRVAGLVDGEIRVADLAIEPEGEVRGDIEYGRLKIAAGGIIEGKFTRANSHATVAEEKTVKLVARTEADNPRRAYVD